MLVVVKMRRGQHSIDMREYEITSKGVVIGEPLRGYRGLTSGIPEPLVNRVRGHLRHCAPRLMEMTPMKNSTPTTDGSALERQLRDMNEQLLVSSVRQHELTEQAQKAEAAAAHLAAIVSSSGDAIISKDLQGIIQTFNKVAQRLFGYTAEEAIGKPATLLIPADRIDEETGILERIGRAKRSIAMKPCASARMEFWLTFR